MTVEVNNKSNNEFKRKLRVRTFSAVISGWYPMAS
jgi:hypothetical protein